MPRRPTYPPLRVLLNGERVGTLIKDPAGAVAFAYEVAWLSRAEAVPVSLSLPLREDAFRGPAVQAVFENLLPDSEGLRRLVAEKVGARGTDAYSLLAEIGRDCVGALQFVPEDEPPEIASREIEAETMSDAAIEALLNNLVKVPLGLEAESDFRISVAGVQEKTALLRHNGRWKKPRGVTPTSHIIKTQIGRLPNGLDLSTSVENEYYCLKVLQAFGLKVAQAEIHRFGARTVLVVERFDRRWLSRKELVRIPQEDCCQALSVAPTLKYQNQGGPGMVEILELLKGSDKPAEDQSAFLQAQILFWLLGATDGHAKNFSVFLGPRGRYRLTPIYDVLSAQPSAERRDVERKHLKLAMFAGDSRHYRLDEICGRHFVQTVKRARLPETLARDALQKIGDTAKEAWDGVQKSLEGVPGGFPGAIHKAVSKGFEERLARIAA